MFAKNTFNIMKTEKKTSDKHNIKVWLILSIAPRGTNG